MFQTNGGTCFGGHDLKLKKYIFRHNKIMHLKDILMRKVDYMMTCCNQNRAFNMANISSDLI